MASWIKSIFGLPNSGQKGHGHHSKGNMGFRVVTWNIGSHGDFRRLNSAYVNEADEKVRNIRCQLLQQAYAMTEMQEMGILCLQEIYVDDWPEVQSILPPDFAYHDDKIRNYRDTVVAWNSKQFTKEDEYIISDSMNSWASAVVRLSHRSSGRSFLVCSAHVSGFNLSLSDDQKKEAAENGDRELKQILNRLHQLKSDSTVIIGADLNAFPDCYSRRHELLKENNYECDSSQEPTFFDDNLRTAVKLDWVAINALSPSTFSLHPLPTPAQLSHEMGPQRHSPADHAPLVIALTDGMIRAVKPN